METRTITRKEFQILHYIGTNTTYSLNSYPDIINRNKYLEMFRSIFLSGNCSSGSYPLEKFFR